MSRYRWCNVCTVNSLPASLQGNSWNVVVTVNTVEWQLCFSPSLSIAKTEHKAEMEVPATTKVKVTDFFQRLVRGLLIFFHSHCCIFCTRWLVCSASDMKQLDLCFRCLKYSYVYNTQGVFLLFLNTTNQGWVSWKLWHIWSQPCLVSNASWSFIQSNTCKTNTNHGYRCSELGFSSTWVIVVFILRQTAGFEVLQFSVAVLGINHYWSQCCLCELTWKFQSESKDS